MCENTPSCLVCTRQSVLSPPSGYRMGGGGGAGNSYGCRCLQSSLQALSAAPLKQTETNSLSSIRGCLDHHPAASLWIPGTTTPSCLDTHAFEGPPTLTTTLEKVSGETASGIQQVSNLEEEQSLASGPRTPKPPDKLHRLIITGGVQRETRSSPPGRSHEVTHLHGKGTAVPHDQRHQCQH